MQNQILDAHQERWSGLRNEIADIVQDPDRWLITPHDLLGGREPIDLLNSGNDQDEDRLRELIESIKHGLFS